MRALFALFVRSMREDARARLPPILRATLGLVILLILWANERDFARRSAPGREFLGMVLFANVGLVAIATLGIFSSAITEEKEDQTLTLLRMTKLSPLAILFGKSTTRLIGALLLLAVQVPFTLLAVTLGGVSIAQVLNSYAVLGATTFMLCNFALFFSVISRSTLRAGIWTGVAGGLLFAVLPIVCITTALDRLSFGALAPSTAWEHFGTWLVESNPAYTLAVLIFEPGKSAPVAWHVAANLAEGVLCFTVSWLVFDRFCTGEGEAIASRTTKRRWQIFSRSRPRPRWPLAWKDFHFLIGGWKGMLIRCAICVLIYSGVYFFHRWTTYTDLDPSYFRRRIGAGTLTFSTLALALEASLTASRIFGDERRDLTLGSIVTLPRTTGSIIRQKILGCLPALIPYVVLFGFGFRLRYFYDDPFGDRWANSFSSDGAAIFYILSQSFLLPILVANLSLRTRRGSMPAGIAAIVALNVLTVVLMEYSTSIGEGEKLAVAASITTVVTVILSIGIYRRIPTAAAAE